MESKNEEKILTKIKKLLALSESSNEHESQLALCRAQELMVKYNIEQNKLSEKDKELSKKIIYEEICRKQRFHWYEGNLINIISNNFKTVSYFQKEFKTGKLYRCLICMGLESDVLITKECYNFILRMIKKFVKEGSKNYNDSKSRARFKNTFILGFLTGLENALKEQVDKNNWGLIILKDAIVIEEESKLNIKNKKMNNGIKPQFSYDDSIYDEGYNKGYDTGSNYNNRSNILE